MILLIKEENAQMDTGVMIQLITLAGVGVTFASNICKAFTEAKKDTERIASIQNGIKENREKSCSEHEKILLKADTKSEKLSTEYKEMSEKIIVKLTNIREAQLQEQTARQTASQVMPKETELANLIKDVYNNNRILTERIVNLERELAVEKEKNRSLEDREKARIEAEYRRE